RSEAENAHARPAELELLRSGEGSAQVAQCLAGAPKKPDTLGPCAFLNAVHSRSSSSACSSWRGPPVNLVERPRKNASASARAASVHCAVAIQGRCEP